MTNALNSFENNQFGNVRVIMKDNEPWFVAQDVCKCLGLDNTAKALYALDNDEKTTINALRANLTNSKVANDFNNLRSSTRIISEAGLYRLVFISHKPEAKKFLRWVTHEVLPAIRRNGYYINKEMIKLLKNEVNELWDNFDDVQNRCNALEKQNDYLLMQTGKHPEFHRVSEDPYINEKFRREIFGVLGIILTKLCIEHELPMMNIPNQTHGRVKTYPKQAFDLLENHCTRNGAYLRHHRRYRRRS